MCGKCAAKIRECAVNVRQKSEYVNVRQNPKNMQMCGQILIKCSVCVVVWGILFGIQITAIAAIMDTLNFAYFTNFDNFAFLLHTLRTFKISFMLTSKVRAFI